MTANDDITGLLADWQNGDKDALERLTPLIYTQLRQIAQKYMFAESGNVTLQPTALVHEAYLRLVKDEIDFKSRKHFFVIAARMMRRILVDDARRRASDKRGGGTPHVTLIEGQIGDDNAEVLAILDFDSALTELGAADAQLSEAVELVCFGGLTTEQAADAMGKSRTQMFDDLRFAKAWLRNKMA